MHLHPRLLALLFVCILWLPTARASVPVFSVRMQTLELGTLATGRPAVVDVWFPQGRCAGIGNGQWCLDDRASSDKVLVFSHGAMGSAPEYGWIGEKLAAAGFVVLGVNHYGESRIYGPDSVNPSSAALIWQRPQDISALLDRLAAKAVFQKPVNWSSVVVMGHSSGGQTAAMLAGATFDLQRWSDYCASAHSREDRSCRYGGDASSAPDAFRMQFGASQQDPRVGMLVMLDPALGPAARPESLRKITVPTLVIGAVHNGFLPWRQHGERYAKEIPGAETDLLSGREGHFVFLSPCRHTATAMGVPLCRDRPGVDRAATQQAVAKAIVRFIQTHDLMPASAGAATAPPRRYSTSTSLVRILTYTPRWVFILLAVLLAFGFLQTRTREVRRWVALVMPVAMLLLSFTGLTRYLGWQWPALVCWLLGTATTAGLGLASMDRRKTIFDPASQRLRIPGSWWPLFVILGIFSTRYALAVSTAMDLGIVHAPHFRQVASLILGGWSGFFVARGVVLWRAGESVRTDAA